MLFIFLGVDEGLLVNRPNADLFFSLVFLAPFAPFAPFVFALLVSPGPFLLSVIMLCLAIPFGLAGAQLGTGASKGLLLCFVLLWFLLVRHDWWSSSGPRRPADESVTAERSKARPFFSHPTSAGGSEASPRDLRHNHCHDRRRNWVRNTNNESPR